MPVEEWRRLRDRLGRMDRHEFLDRSRQELAKRADAVLYRVGYDFSRGILQPSSNRTPKFFFLRESVGQLVATLRQRLPKQSEEIVRQADKICEHKFDLLGYRNLDYGNPIRWQVDAVHGKRAPRRPFYQVRYLDFEEVGDSKVVWELNRHQHLVTLAKAFLLTNEQRYSDEMLRQWHDWQVDNPYPVGINWASSLEAAFRSLSWIWMYHLLEGSSALPSDFRRLWLRAQALNGRHIERYLSTYFSPNTHLLGEAVALFFLGVLCPELSAAERWKSRGWEIVLAEMQRQVRPDGFHFEQSTYYHVYALDFFLHAALLAQTNGMTVPKMFEETIERMLNALCLLGRGGTVPAFGDDDGGRLFDPRRNRGEHLLDPVGTGAILFHRGDFKAAVGDLCEETVWLLGEPGIAEWDRLEPQPPAQNSTGLPDSGLYLLTTTKPPSQLVIDAGPQGAQSAGHRHADALSICLQSRGRTLIIDPGTFEYVGPGRERDLFRSTAMHNTLRVDNESQAEPAGPFSWHRLPHTKVEEWIQGKNFDFFAGSHDGYARGERPVIHRRFVFSAKSGLFLVWDFALGEGEHRLDISWHMGPGLAAKGAHVFGPEGSHPADKAPRIAILPAEAHGWNEEFSEGQCSPVYGVKEAASVLNFGVRTKLPAEFVTLLVPLGEAMNPGELVRRAGASSSVSVRAVSYHTESREYDFFLADKGVPWSCGRVASDAEFVCLSTEGKNDRTVILCNGSHLELEGQQLFRAGHPVSRWELTVRDGHREISCSEPDAMSDASMFSLSGRR